MVQLDHVPVDRRARITFWDTWGLDETNYQSDQLEALFGGLIHPGVSMTESIHPDRMIENAKTRDQRRKLLWLCFRLVVFPLFVRDLVK